MLKLHGIAISNYTNMVQAVLPEKELACELVVERPSRDALYLAIRPMLKAPVLEKMNHLPGDDFVISQTGMGEVGRQEVAHARQFRTLDAHHAVVGCR
jgi:hypothetical protein